MTTKLVDPAVVGVRSIDQNPTYPVTNERYKKLDQHPQWALFSKALEGAAISLQQLRDADFKLPDLRAIEAYHKSVAAYPQTFHPHRIGLAMPGEDGKLKIVEGLDATRMGYAQTLTPVTMTGMPFEKEAFMAQTPEKQRAIAVKDFEQGKLLYNATKLEQGADMPATILSQGPQSEATASVFLKMIVDAKVTHIVALGALRTVSQFCSYWPSTKGASVNALGATIKLLDEEVIATDVDKWQKLVKRTLQLDIVNVGSRKITQYHWIGYDFSDQKPSFPVLDTLQERLLELTKDETLLIHCHDGMVRSSTVALSFFALKDLERQKDKDRISVNPLDLAFRLYTERPAVEKGSDVETVYQYLREKGVERLFDEDHYADATDE